ncbi:MAG TPA: nucleotidyltransferase substrate binding protein [Candidatus Avamphibacillus sp.]|nr:nucleotidyltransferase substrate binding protein [Candidatus Avamphibacillus sp.]
MSKERIYEKLRDYKRACERLEDASKVDIVNDVIYDGVIQRFEFTFELSWKLMKAFLEFTGITEIRSPRDAIREAFAFGLIQDGDQWIDMLTDRNKTSHIYDEKESRIIYEKIVAIHKELLIDFGNEAEEKIKQYRK